MGSEGTPLTLIGEAVGTEQNKIKLTKWKKSVSHCLVGAAAVFVSVGLGLHWYWAPPNTGINSWDGEPSLPLMWTLFWWSSCGSLVLRGG